MRIADFRSTSMPVGAAGVAPAAATPPCPQDVAARVSLSPAAQKLAAGLTADPGRIDQVKGLVQRGALAVDPLRIAQAMLAA
jgi:hypothetical protein